MTRLPHGLRLLLIIPCRDEAGSVGGLLGEIAALNAGFDTLVIDDASRDDTFLVASRRSPVIRLVSNLGIGGAVQTGIKYALSQGYDYCAQIDGDGQHPPGEYLRLLEVALANDADLTIGSRYAGLVSFRSTPLRRFGGRLISAALYGVHRARPISDPTSGMRLMNRRAMRFFSEHYPSDYPEPISLAWALREGLRVVETPARMRERHAGVSSLKGVRKSFSYMVRVIGYVVISLFRKVDDR